MLRSVWLLHRSFTAARVVKVSAVLAEITPPPPALSLFSDIGYESLINLMLKDLFKLLVACVSEPAETISRVGCSCIRSGHMTQPTLPCFLSDPPPPMCLMF